MIFRYIFLLSTISLFSVNAQATESAGLSEIDSYIHKIRNKLQAFEEADEANESVQKALQDALGKKLKEREEHLSSTEASGSWLKKEDIENMRKAAKSGQSWEPSTDDSNSSTDDCRYTTADCQRSTEMTSMTTTEEDVPLTLKPFPRKELMQAENSDAKLERIWQIMLTIEMLQGQLRQQINRVCGNEASMLHADRANDDHTVEDDYLKLEREGTSRVLRGRTGIESEPKAERHSTASTAEEPQGSSKKQAPKRRENKWLKEYEALRAKMDE